MTKTEELKGELVGKLEELYAAEGRKKVANEEFRKEIQLLESEIHQIVQEIRAEESGAAALPFPREAKG